MSVAEVGAERTFWNLRVIEDLCDESYAVNIFFHVPVTPPPPTEAVRLLADMNDLPFLSGSLDLLIYSATLHHSSDLKQALREAGRILKPGGRAIVINEPVAGRFKRFGGTMEHDRAEDIHEDEVRCEEWRRAIQESALTADHFVPSWFVGQIQHSAGLPSATRFRQLGAALRPLAKISLLADIGRSAGRVPAQSLLGLPLNCVLWKS